MKRFLIGCCLLALAGCGGSGGGGTSSGQTASSGGQGGASSGITTGGTMGSLAYPWNRYFVTAYDQAKVLAQRARGVFTHSTITYSLQVNGSPVYGTAQTVTTNAQLEAGLDYAFSTGLTGKGQIVGMIDSHVNTAHEQFDGKNIYSVGGTGSDFHGTAVASVMVGDGTRGQMTGIAPGADLFTGYIDYSQPADWVSLGQEMLAAKSAGAIAVNNSWGLAGYTVANTNYPAFFGAGTAGASYISALRSYEQSGIVVFAAQNDYTATSIDAMAGLPQAYPDLQPGWLAVINAIPHFQNGSITSADRISAPCAEAAQYCLAADGQTIAADNTNPTGYVIAQGASFAAPQVTGALALLAEAFPDLTAKQLRDRLLATANNSFFTPTGTVTFAPGVTHGYDSEFGMGFLDLKAALLPIGTTAVPMSNGSALPQGSTAITGGFASGNAVTVSLSSARVISLDSLGGAFTSSASLIGADTREPVSDLRLGRAMSGDFGAVRKVVNARLSAGFGLTSLQRWDLMGNLDAATLAGQGSMPVLSRAGTLVSVLRDKTGMSGISAVKTLPLGRARLSLGAEMFSESGALLGVTAPGYQRSVNSHARSLRLAFAAPLGGGTALRLDGAVGIARGTGGGMIAGFTPVSYNRFGIALDHADAFTRGDVLTLFARQPVAITSGQAIVDLPTAYSRSGVSFTNTGIDLGPAHREVDLGAEYAAPIGRHGSVTMGMAYKVNDGNVPGRTGIGAALALRFDL